MPTHVAPVGSLIVTFCHGDDDREEIAVDAHHALQIAFGMLVRLEELTDGDLISVRRVKSYKRKLLKPAGESDGR
jgi:hypothetical protein